MLRYKTVDKEFITLLRELYSIPNAPYSLKPREKYIREKIRESGLAIDETPHYISVKLNQAPNKTKVIIISHLDHPGFVLKNKSEGRAFGTLYLDRVKGLEPLVVYTKEGKKLGRVNIEKIYGRDESRIKISSDFQIPTNSQALWDVEVIKTDDEYFHGRSHDNDIATAVLLNNVKRVEREDFQFIFLFTKHEEILQQSSFNIAKYNSLGIKKGDLVINLESMKVYPTTKRTKYSKLNYEDGLVLNVAEATSIYGSGSKARNIAESLINNTSDKLNIKIQTGMPGGTSDARAINSFELTGNIVTINIPNEYKHNSDGKEIVTERVKRKDVQSLNHIIRSLLKEDLETKGNKSDISGRLKEEFPNFSAATAAAYFQINNRLDLANRDIIRRGYYFPESIMDYIKDFFWKALSHLSYYSSKPKIKQVSKD